MVTMKSSAFSERDGYNSRVVSIIYSGEGSVIPDKERTLLFPSCYTTSLIWHSRHNLLVFMNERDYEWTDILVEGIRETFQTRVLWLSVTYFSRVYHMCQEEIAFCAGLQIWFSENRGILITTPLFFYESTSFDKSLPSFGLC